MQNENLAKAIEALSQVSSVREWNRVREQFKYLLTPEEISEIDGSGLIVKVLGPDVKNQNQTT